MNNIKILIILILFGLTAPGIGQACDAAFGPELPISIPGFITTTDSSKRKAVVSDPYHDVLLIGDIHGDFEGILRKVVALQKSRGKAFKHIFQVGDFGYYPTMEMDADDGSSRKSQFDFDQYGVQDYLNGDTRFNKYFSPSKNELGYVQAKIYFVRGNHENQFALREKNKEGVNPIAADERGHVFYVPDGSVFSIELEPGLRINIAGYGGVDPKTRNKAVKRDAGIGFDETNMEHLFNYSGSIALLITHQGPDIRVKGSTEIDALVSLTEPQIHVHGHSHINYPLECLGESTLTCGLGRFYANRSQDSSEYFRILRVHNDARIEIVDLVDR